MNNKISGRMFYRNRGLLLLMLLITTVLGTFEGIYGRVRYSGDAINYLNIMRALHSGDWKLAFSSYWGLGYPLLLALVTPLFPHSPSGEWVAIHVVNLAVFLATFFCFYWLVRTIAGSSYFEVVFEEVRVERRLLIGSFAIFLSIELTMDNVSRVGPDMLISCLMFAACALLIKLKDDPTHVRALVFGALLGAGYVVKAIFLPLTAVFALVMLLALWNKKSMARYLALMLVAMAVIALPYIAGLSWAVGHFTSGDSGPLNYAWNVNKLEPGGLWQGQPPRFGTPIHPVKMVMEGPHVYLFDGPFPVTFAPFYNPPYYYQGYRRLFSIKAQLRAFGGNVFRLFKMLRVQYVIYALTLYWAVSWKRDTSAKWPKTQKDLWPLLVVSGGGTFIYLLVFVEARYVASFLALALLVLLVAVVKQSSVTTQNNSFFRSNAGFACLLMAACAASFLFAPREPDRDVIGHARNHQLFYNNDEWKAGIYLQQTGLQPGDKVAVMADLVSATLSTWAYMDHLQIVGILGGSLLENQTFDFDTFWHATPQRQREILENFRGAGARLVLAISKPDGVEATGWERVPQTSYWIYRF